ncbi:hypothetical protein TA3x_003299 [Tundrisphaera sp. TA3]|uniref:hypothetical protein n=1 Tax=Tundrisphaera sp. TA3 TaxID=3435775 RepID=UPI003EBC50A1
MRSSLLAITLSLLLSGCGSSTVENSPAVFENNALSEIGTIYRLYSEVSKKPPQSLKDFAPYREGTPDGINAAARGEIVILWGAKLNDLTEEGTGDSPDEVLAYMKEVPEKGGLVLMKNRKIKSMTAEEFKAAPKAGS